MNLPTDLRTRHDYAAKSQRICKETLCEIEEDTLPWLHGAKEAGARGPDLLCIEIDNVDYQYKTVDGLSGGVRGLSAVMPQGGLYTIVGPPSEGKGTLLRLLGDVLHSPYDDGCEGGQGALVVPSHLRVLHVTKDPTFLDGTLLYN